MEIKNLLKENKGTIVDVRSIEEYRGGHVVGSLDIPLQERPERMEGLKCLERPLL